MATAGLLALLDDISTLLDDVALMTKVASKKTAGVVGDDLALNAHQVSGVSAARELPVVAAVAKGSLLNKAVLIPVALLVTALAPFAVKPLLMVGGAFLCFEGVEKVLHKLLHPKAPAATGPVEHDGGGDPAAVERVRVAGAVRTDFILSAEILVIALGSAAGASFVVQAVTLCVIGLGMTVGVYGLVALIVKADDVGVSLQQLEGDAIGAKGLRGLGRGIVAAAPVLMKFLSVAGTVAMFMVGGEILAHSVPPIEHWLDGVAQAVVGGAPMGVAGGLTILAALIKSLLVVALGAAIGLLVVGVVAAVRLMRQK
jgi:predicted DNA repair protein MutK